MADRFLDLPAVCYLTSFGKTWIGEQVAAGTFPKPIKFGNINRWSYRDVQQWIAKQKRATGHQEYRVSA